MADSPRMMRSKNSCVVPPKGLTSPMPVTATRRRGTLLTDHRGLQFLEEFDHLADSFGPRHIVRHAYTELLLQFEYQLEQRQGIDPNRVKPSVGCHILRGIIGVLLDKFLQ